MIHAYIVLAIFGVSFALSTASAVLAALKFRRRHGH